MCEWGTHTMVEVLVAADLAAEGVEIHKPVAIDSCIASLVEALQEAGIDMRASCCGHGKRPGRIDLADGRTLRISSDPREVPLVHSAHHALTLPSETQKAE